MRGSVVGLVVVAVVIGGCGHSETQTSPPPQSSPPAGPAVRKVEREIFADYFHFAIEDDTSAASHDYSDTFTKEAIDRQLASKPGVVVVTTVRNMTVPVVVEIASAAPPDDAAAQLVTECSMDVPSGRIIVMGNDDALPDVPRIAVQTGRHRVRVFYYGLDTVSVNGLEGKDRYRVVLWPDGELVAPKVLVDKRKAHPSHD